jgi:indole-3-glycerol phosphate synthase
MTVAADSDFLLSMAAASRLRDAATRQSLSDAQQRSMLTSAPAAVPLMLADNGFDIIAELKKRSPAEGELGGALSSVTDQARAYRDGGAAVLSVLTEPERFSGSLDDLHEIAMADRSVPAMRKDFLVSRYQVREARLAGASGVLMIAAMLDADQLEAMLEVAFEQGLFVLMEVFDEADLDKCVPVLERCGPAVAEGQCRYLLGVNCRDLRTLKINFDRFAAMAPLLPTDMPWVAESGVTETAHAVAVAALGYRMALIGTALMRSGDPAATVRGWKAAGVAACS